MAANRRLAAILAADVAGYSRLIGADEEGTLERLRAIRSELVDPAIAAHNGRIVKTTGDGLLIEFGSTVDALRCAGEVQACMTERNAEIRPENRIEFRIGIHQGDIVVEDGDILGDGVNIAARLEGLAEPGGICVSARVQEDAAGKLDLAFRDLGQQQLKNIARLVRAYAIDVASVTPSGLAATSSPRLSIVVLPFAHLNNDPEQQYFADAITEDLTTDLSRIAGMFVIARNSAFTYQGKRIDTRQIGRELGVRYVLEGSVRRLGDHIRINAQLIDAETGGHLWAERFDRHTSDLFALQDEITGRIAVALSLELVSAEAVRPTDHPEALDYVFRARAASFNYAKGPDRDSLAEGIKLFDLALALDPRSVEALTGAANTLSTRVMNFISDSPTADLERAEKLIERASAISPHSPVTLMARAHWLKAQGRGEEAIPEYEMLIVLNRNSVSALANLSNCKVWAGFIDESIALLEQVLRLSPRDPYSGNRYGMIGYARLLQSRIDEAIVWLEKGCNLAPSHPGHRAVLAAAYGLKGETERAAAELAEARRLCRDDRYSSIARLKANPYSAYSYSVPEVRALIEATIWVGYRRAGMPEE